MHWVWHDNDVFLQHQDVTVYHAYKDDMDQRLIYHYALDPAQVTTFDVRDLPRHGRLDDLYGMAAAIRAAIDAGLITQEAVEFGDGEEDDA